MAITPLTPLPIAPSSAIPANFKSEADNFVAALPVMVTEINARAVEIDAIVSAMDLNDTVDTSVSSVAIGTGSKTFTVTAGKSFIPGMFLIIADSAAPTTNYMVCQVVSYSSTTLTLTSISIVGSGTKASWNISGSMAQCQRKACVAKPWSERILTELWKNAQCGCSMAALQTRHLAALQIAC
jgi:hypothetical protein